MGVQRMQLYIVLHLLIFGEMVDSNLNEYGDYVTDAYDNYNYDYDDDEPVVKENCPRCSDLYFDCYEDEQQNICIETTTTPALTTTTTTPAPTTTSPCVEQNIFHGGKPF